MTKEELRCSSVPGEVYISLSQERHAALFTMQCKACGHTLLSIHTEHATSPDNKLDFTRKYAYFRCECGKKYKKLALDLNPGGAGYRCRQAAVEEVSFTLRQGKRLMPKSKYVARLFLSGKRIVEYNITEDDISENYIEKKGEETNG